MASTILPWVWLTSPTTNSTCILVNDLHFMNLAQLYQYGLHELEDPVT